MALDLRTKLNGFSIQTLKQHLAKIESDSAYSYYADVIRAFLSNNAEDVAKYQQDERSQVASQAHIQAHIQVQVKCKSSAYSSASQVQVKCESGEYSSANKLHNQVRISCIISCIIYNST